MSVLDELFAAPPPPKSIQNRVGTRRAPYRRKDGVETVKVQAAIGEANELRLRRVFEQMPPHVGWGAFLDVVIQCGMSAYESRVSPAQASAPLAVEDAQVVGERARCDSLELHATDVHGRPWCVR